MLYLLFLTLPLALWLLYKLPYWEAARDYAAIQANGSADTLKESFHTGRLLYRLAMIASIAILAAAPLVPRNGWPWLLLIMALVVLGFGWFGYCFNPMLSRLRGLDPYYLSAAEHAAYVPDRLLTKLGLPLKPVLLGCLLTATAAALLLAGGAYLTY